MSNGRKRIVFLAGALSQPRIIRRIEGLSKAGFECKVYGYDTGVYSENKINPHIDTIVLGKVNNGKDHISKLRNMISSVKEVINKEKDENTIFYAFGFKFAINLFLRKVPYIYEISDILYGYSKFRRIIPLFKFIDKCIIRKSKLTVMTSDGFREWFGFSPNKKIHILPNRVNQYYLGKRPKPKTDFNSDHLVFGFIGAPRSIETVGVFAKVIGEKFPQHDFVFYGENSNTPKFKDLLSHYNNVKFMGSFKNPEDLEKIYGEVDIIVSAYDNRELNEQILDANKLYESLFFCRPIIMSEKTFSSKQVAKYKNGYIINPTSEESIELFVKNISANELCDISRTICDVPESESIDEIHSLVERLGQTM